MVSVLSRQDLNSIERRMELSRLHAEKRRKLLVEAGCSTYILTTRNGMTVILCLCCGTQRGFPHRPTRRTLSIAIAAFAMHTKANG